MFSSVRVLLVALQLALILMVALLGGGIASAFEVWS